MKTSVPVRPFWYSDVLVFPKLITVITTLDEQGNVNAAPYSFIMQYDVMTQNPRLILGFRNTSDTFRNIEATGELVINCPTAEHLDDMMETAKFYPRGHNELDHTRFTTIPSTKVKPPSLKECPQIIECTADKIYCLDNVQGHVHARIEALVFDDELINLRREDRIRRMNLPIGLGDESRRHYYFTNSTPLVHRELDVDALAGSHPPAARTLPWDEGALAALEKVPKPVQSLVVSTTEEIVRKEGGQRVTLQRFEQLAEEYAPPDVLARFEEGSPSVSAAPSSPTATALDGLQWRGNSRSMFDAAVNGSPRPFRARASKSLQAAIRRHADNDVVDEQAVLASVADVTPKAFVHLALRRLEPLRTQPDAASCGSGGGDAADHSARPTEREDTRS